VDLCALGVAELGRLYRARTLSPVEVARATLDRIERLNPVLNAYISVLDKDALAAARAVEAQFVAGCELGPLQGIPVSVKDIMNVQGSRTTAASKILQHAPFDVDDAEAVSRLRAGGAVLIGKTNLHEFAFGAPASDSPFGIVQNPRRVGHMPGGSSSGSAAAVAAGLGVLSLGTDTGGSVRNPASICGLVGLKPTHGLVPLDGVIPVSEQLDDVGPIGRSVADVAAALSAMVAQQTNGDGSMCAPSCDYVRTLNTDVRGLRVGLPTNTCFEFGQPSVLALQAHARQCLRDIGLTLIPVVLPRAEEIRAIWDVIAPADLLTYHQRHGGREELYGEPFRGRVRMGREIQAIDYARALAAKADVRRQWLAAFDGVDLLVLPGNVAPAQRHGVEAVDIAGRQYTTTMVYSPFNRTANMTGFPSLVLPIGEDDGLPISIQLQAAPHREAQLLAVAHALEQALGNLCDRWGIDVRGPVP
jgi:aspartyl-tRNA(Asn)/glutamyl-tRNA(Gln) amidotransferase subunit A